MTWQTLSHLALVLCLLLLPVHTGAEAGKTEKQSPGALQETIDHSDHLSHSEEEADTLPQPGQSNEADPTEWVSEKGGQYVPLDAVFKNEKGEQVTLGQLIDRPTLLLPVYYFCPKACSFDMANLADALKNTSHPLENFNVISMSFNEMETPEVAAIAKPNYTELLGKDFPTDKWSFLTGDLDNIKKVTRSIGYRFKKLDNLTYIHPSAMVALAEDGKIIKYIYGSFLFGDVDIALAEAEKGTPTTSIRRFLAFCFNYSPTQNQKIFTILKLGTIAVLGFGGFFFIYFLVRTKKE